MVTITTSLSRRELCSELNRKRSGNSARQRASSCGPPASRKGKCPARIDSSLAASLSMTTTWWPRSASTSDSGRPTCPAPPTTATRRRQGAAEGPASWTPGVTTSAGSEVEPQQSKTGWPARNTRPAYSRWGQPMKTASLLATKYSASTKSFLWMRGSEQKTSAPSHNNSLWSLNAKDSRASSEPGLKAMPRIPHRRPRSV
mmetsp:Transcript_29778/g.78005  ORF Transcript_29778/g.78005 Transcript_29778/m.78005 type:complete len:201 (+) Transcript_29778:240-842(+)